MVTTVTTSTPTKTPRCYRGQEIKSKKIKKKLEEKLGLE